MKTYIVNFMLHPPFSTYLSDFLIMRISDHWLDCTLGLTNVNYVPVECV